VRCCSWRRNVRLNGLRSQLKVAQRELCVLCIAKPTEETAAGTGSAETTPVTTVLASTPYPSTWSLPPTSSVRRRKLPQTPVSPATLASTTVLPGTLPQAAMTSSMASTVVPALSSGTHRPVLGMPLVVPAVTQALNLPTRSLTTAPVIV